MQNVFNNLKGFTLSASNKKAVVTLYNYNKLYINAQTRKLLGIKEYDKLFIAINKRDKSIALLKDSKAIEGYHIVDKNFYISDDSFGVLLGDNYVKPIVFHFKEYVDGAYIFNNDLH